MSSYKDFTYSLGSFSASILGQTVSAFAIFFYVDVLKVPTRLISLVMVFYGIWNAVNDPLFGQISDRTRTRWGRRKPYIIWFTVPLCVAFALLWMPPFPEGAVHQLFVYYFVVIFFFDGLFTIVVLNWTALFPEMYPELEDRARVSALRQILGILGLIAAVALPPMIYGSLGWKFLGVLYGALGLVTMYASLLGAQERPEFAQDQGLGLLQALRYTFINKSFMTYVIPAMLIQYTFVALPAAIPFYAKYVLKATDFQTTLFLGTLFVMAIPFAAVWAKIVSRLGPKKSFIRAMIYYGVCLLPFFVAQNYIHAILIAVLLSFGLAGLMVLLDIFIADVTDEDEVRTGVRREGMYFGVNGFMIRLGISMNAVIMGSILDSFGYNPNLPEQPASALLGMRLLMTLIPIAAVALALLIFRYYPLEGERLREIKMKVNALHLEKASRKR